MKIEFWRFQGGWSVVINGKVTQGVHFFETFARVKALCFRLGLLTPEFPEPLPPQTDYELKRLREIKEANRAAEERLGGPTLKHKGESQ